MTILKKMLMHGVVRISARAQDFFSHMRCWAVLILSPILLAGCMAGPFVADMSTAFHAPVSWKEEVLLHDGRQIIVDRYVSYGIGGKMSGGAPIDRYTLDFTDPETNRGIHWESDHHLSPMLLDFKDGVPYLANNLHNCVSFEKYGRPVPGYVLFKYIGNKWERISLADFPKEFSEANLLVSATPKGAMNEKSYVDRGYIAHERVRYSNKFVTRYLKSLLRDGSKGMWSACIWQIEQREQSGKK